MPVGLKHRKKPEPVAPPKPSSQPVVSERRIKKATAYYAKTATRAITVGLRETKDMAPEDAMRFLEAFHTELQAKIQKGDFEPPFLDSAVIAAKERVEKQRELDAAK